MGCCQNAEPAATELHSAVPTANQISNLKTVQEEPAPDSNCLKEYNSISSIHEQNSEIVYPSISDRSQILLRPSSHRQPSRSSSFMEANYYNRRQNPSPLKEIPTLCQQGMALEAADIGYPSLEENLILRTTEVPATERHLVQRTYPKSSIDAA